MTLNRKTAPEYVNIELDKLREAPVYRLDNGMEVYLVNSGNNPGMLRVELLFDAGSIRQSMPLQAYATSKLIFEGTRSKDARQIAEAFDYYGAYTENDHGLDSSTITLFVLKEYLPQTLPLIVEILTESVFPDHELSIYKQIGKQNLAVRKMKTSYLASTTFNHELFGDHPYGTLVNEEDYDALDTEHLKYFYSNYFKPSSAKIIIAGQAGEEEIKLLNQHLGQLAPSTVVLADPPAVKVHIPGSYRFIDKEDSLQATVCMGVPVINRSHPEFRELLLLNLILGGYFGSRLMKNIREEKGYTYGIYSHLRTMKQASVFITQTDVRNEVHNKTVDEIVKEVGRLQSVLVGEEELTVAKNYLTGHFVRSLDGDFALADKIKQMLKYGLGYDYYNSYIETIRNTAAEKLMELARKYLKPEEMLTVIAGKTLVANEV